MRLHRQHCFTLAQCKVYLSVIPGHRGNQFHQFHSFVQEKGFFAANHSIEFLIEFLVPYLFSKSHCIFYLLIENWILVFFQQKSKKAKRSALSREILISNSRIGIWRVIFSQIFSMYYVIIFVPTTKKQKDSSYVITKKPP